ncbi:P-loop NTPase fold protein [Streptomyces sp. NPDC087422]|uniref:P-loop NTPase fold protein n=1 Tax=Streptomyces sp. NPDC087422 TaxID=3365786 RepID=UPI0038218FFD
MSSPAAGPPPMSPYATPYATPYAFPNGSSYPPVTPPAFALLNDEPVADETRDLLGANRAAAQLTGLLVASRDATPFTLAVDAGWGMGKSSLMRLVDVRLQRFPDVHTVWYNAWTSTGGDALEGLIKSVLNQVDPSILRRALRRIRAGGALMGLLRALTVVAAGPLGVAGMVDELWKRLSVDAGARNGMRDALRDMVGEWTATRGSAPGGKLLVIFIDDLDRCSEQTFLAVCEAVKVYLDVPGLAFVIGCDRAAIGPGGLLPDLSPAGAAFVEKIFQTSYRIPAPSGREIQAYVRSCAELAGIDHLLDPHLVELLAYRAARNPRRVKRLLNGLLLEASLNPVWAGIRPEAVIRTLLLQYLYPDFHRMMTAPAGPGDDADVVREFRTYRRVRTRLWSPAPLADPDRPMVADFLRAHSLPPLHGHEDHGTVLADLEAQLPVGFPDLAGDPAFVSLVEDLVALPESELVLRRLRQGTEDGETAPYPPLAGPWESAPQPAAGPEPGDPVASPGPSGSSVDYGDTGVGTPPYPGPVPGYGQGPVQGYGYGYPRGDGSPYEPDPLERPQSVSPALDDPELAGYGADAPAWHAPQQGSGYPAGTPERTFALAVAAGFARGRGRAIAQLLTVSSAVLPADTEAELVQIFAEHRPALLLCHAGFADEPAKGFALVRGVRSRGYAGPVIFYSGRITPNDRAAAGALEAVITDDLTAVPAIAETLTSGTLAPGGLTPGPFADQPFLAPRTAAPRSAAPSVPPARPSDGRPR